MNTVQNIVHIVLTATGGALGWFLGGMDGFMYALCAFMIIDYITGVANAIVQKKLSSSVGFKGLIRKGVILALVGVGHILDLYVLGNGNAIRTAVIFFYLCNEGVSLLENSARLGLPIPEKLKQVLTQLQEEKQ